MTRNHVDDEFVAVRVQDPRVQKEGSWNSYVDYKLFLHTNSRAFTAKTSCVRRRYSEFVWLKKKLQKNAGLVPVPDLPGKSFFYFSNEDFLERRRKGLQAFLNNVVHMTVCLSDSQLHLFLQTQLPISHIQDCVQGLTPYSVTDAILTYASSNRGLAQAQEDSIREHSLTISYESMESPAPHQPNASSNFESLPCGDSDALEDILELSEQDLDETLLKQNPSVTISQRSDHLEAVVEDRDPTQATFYLGENSDDSGSLSSTEQTERRSCQIQTPVEVHSPMGTDGGVDSVFEEESVTINTEENTEDHLDSKENEDVKKSEAGIFVNSEEILGLKVADEEQEVTRLEDVCCENPSQVPKSHVVDVKPVRDLEKRKSPEPGREEETLLQSEHHEETQIMNGAPEVDTDDSALKLHQEDVGHKEDSCDEDSCSLLSSNESIVKCSEEEKEDLMLIRSSPEDVQNWSEVDVSTRDILDLHVNGCLEEKEDISGQEDEDQQYVTNLSELSQSPELKAAVAVGDLNENSDFSILESSCQSGGGDGKCTQQDILSSSSLDGSGESQGLEVH
uniref:Sorting nexin 11 n=1 Tax=Nothobranchius rachovii TaxID=451742 RepID=A0A1A8PPT3_9TELE